MATGIMSFTLEELKRQANEMGLEGKEKTKFLREEWRRLQDAALKRWERQPIKKRGALSGEEKDREMERKKKREAEKEERRLSCSLKSWLSSWNSKSCNRKE